MMASIMEVSSNLQLEERQTWKESCRQSSICEHCSRQDLTVWYRRTCDTTLCTSCYLPIARAETQDLIDRGVITAL